MGTTRDFINQLKVWGGQVATFLRVFVSTFITQLLALGINSLTELRSYLISAGASLAMICFNWLNPKDKRYGIGSDKEG